jgi:hypothetical protein
MNGKKFLILLCGAVFALLSLFLQAKAESDKVKENWMGMGSMTWKVQRIEQLPGCPPTNTLGSTLTHLPEQQFIKVANKQALMSPRFDNSGGTVNIRYNPPAVGNRACDSNSPYVTQTPEGNMGTARYEGYANANSNERENFAPTCGAGGTGVPMGGGINNVGSSYANGNFNQVLTQAIQNSPAPVMVDALPLTTMSSIGADGQQTNPVVYNNFMFANKKSRLWAQQDMIRGSIPIAPDRNPTFQVSVQPHIDLNAGALAVIGGGDNSTARATANLIAASAGSTSIPAAGMSSVAMMNMAPMYQVNSNDVAPDISVRASV